MLVCVFFAHFAHGTAGAARIRHSPRPLISRRESSRKPRAHRAARMRTPVHQRHCEEHLRRSNPFFLDAVKWIASLRLAMTVANPSRRLRRLQPEPGLDRVTHDEFLDLAGDGHREFVDEFDVARDLVVRDLAMAEGADFLGRQRLAGSRPDPGAQLLAITIVGDAENLHVLNLRVTVQKFLDLARIEIFAAADHHVLDAADDVAVTFRVDHGDIAGVHPAIGIAYGGGLLRLFPLAHLYVVLPPPTSTHSP